MTDPSSVCISVRVITTMDCKEWLFVAVRVELQAKQMMHSQLAFFHSLFTFIKDLTFLNKASFAIQILKVI